MPSLSDRFGANPNEVEDLEDTIQRIKECEGSPDLNDWEEDFLESIKEQVMNGRTLTTRQEDKLEQVEVIAAEGREGWD